MVNSHRRGRIRIPVIWRRAKNERRTGVLALRLWRGNQRRVTLYNISDLSFYKFWECAWKIFERIREEKILGRSKISSINTGFDQALRAILDANVTTLIAAVILFFLGSGPIRGFSITLGLGVVSTILCTMIISRLLINYFYILNPNRKIEI